MLALATFLAFLPTLGNEFVNWDDDANFLTNSAYRGLAPENLRWMFTTSHLGHYQPLSWVTLGLDYCLWGMNAWGYHLTSLLLHIANVILFYRILLRLLKRSGSPGTWPAAIGALLFAIHPLRVESVAWATERRDVLSGFFLLGAVWAYLRREAEEQEGKPARIGWLILSVALFTGSLLSKAVGVLLPVVLLVLDIYPLRRFTPGRRRAVLLEKLPYLLSSLLAAMMALQAADASKVAFSFRSFSALERIEQASYGLCFYLVKTILPINLSPLYLAPVQFDPLAPVLVAGVVGALLLTAVLVALRGRRPELLAAWVCYVLFLVPVLGLVPVGPQIAADRYTYLADLPWAVLAAFLLTRFGLPASRGALAAAAGLVALLGVLTFQQTRVWAESTTLWTRALDSDPSNFVAWHNRGTARAAKRDLPGAIQDLDQAIRLYPAFPEAHYNRGSLRMDAGDLAGAIEDETEAIRLAPEYAPAWQIRGMARRLKGDGEGAKADLAEGQRLEAAARASTPAGLPTRGPAPSVDSAEVQARNNKGNQLASRGDFDGAIAEYTEALRLDPSSAAIYNNRGNARASKGDQSGAVLDYTETLRLDPNLAEAYANRGLSRAILKDLPGAVDDYSRALELAPRDPDVYANRGAARASLGQRAAAIGDLEAALASAPLDWPRRRIVQALLVQLRGR